MISLSDIFPVRSIYFGSGFAVLVWTLPYTFGLAVYHLRASHWAKGIGWLLFILFIPSIVLSRVFAWELENDLYTPRTILMSVSCVVAAGQAVFWALLWNEYRRRGESGPWHTIAAGAFAGSVVLALMSCGSFYLETRYRYLEGIRLSQEAAADLRHLEKAGYVQYPDADYRFGQCMVREEYENEMLAGYVPERPGGYSEALDIDFTTSDDPSKVLDFYSDHAGMAGMTVRRGVSRTSGAPMMVGAKPNGSAIIVEFLPVSTEASEHDWSVTIYWNIPAGFVESLDLNFELEQTRQEAE